MNGGSVFTGCGAICGAGRTVDAIWGTILEGRSAVQPITQWDTGRWPIHVAAEIRGVDERTLVDDRRLHKIVSRTDLFGLYAAGAALEQSGLLTYRDGLTSEAAARFNDRSGVIAGSGGGTYRSQYDFFPLLNEARGDAGAFGRELTSCVDPMWLLRNLPNNVVCHVGIRSGFKGTNACITNQCVGGVMAVAEATASLSSGEADRMIAIGHDTPIEPETVLHYHELGLLARGTLRPFASDREGTIFGEGAGALVLETATDARTRGAAILGECLGSGCTTEATGVVDVRPDGDGVARAITIALAEAGLSPGDVGMIVAHGNGTRASDASEVAAIRRVFGETPPPVTAFKWATGHLISASGILDVILALRALRQRVVPGVATLDSIDPTLAPFPVSRSPQTPRSDVAVTLCRGFAGMNVALVVRTAPAAAAR